MDDDKDWPIGEVLRFGFCMPDDARKCDGHTTEENPQERARGEWVRTEERKRIVATLRKLGVFASVADYIERGDHWKEGG